MTGIPIPTDTVLVALAIAREQECDNEEAHCTLANATPGEFSGGSTWNVLVTTRGLLRGPLSVATGWFLQ